MTAKQTTKRRLSPAKAEQAKKNREAFQKMASVLNGELKEGKHTARLARVPQEAQGLQRYSPLNQLLILTQCPHATDVAGYVAWLEKGYQVRKGEKGIGIIAPHERKGAAEGQQQAGEGGEGSASVGFHRISVFDISQCDRIEPEKTGNQEQQETQEEAEASAEEG